MKLAGFECETSFAFGITIIPLPSGAPMADWIPKEDFDRTEYGQRDKQPGAMNFIGRLAPEHIPPGGRVVADPKDGRFGIIVDAQGIVVCKVALDAP